MRFIEDYFKKKFEELDIESKEIFQQLINVITEEKRKTRYETAKEVIEDVFIKKMKLKDLKKKYKIHEYLIDFFGKEGNLHPDYAGTKLLKLGEEK